MELDEMRVETLKGLRIMRNYLVLADSIEGPHSHLVAKLTIPIMFEILADLIDYNEIEPES